jgi:hypothetical protein
MPDWIFKNKPTAYATLASPSGTSGTTLTLTTGHGTRLPAPGVGQISAVRIENELITYTGNSGDVLTGVTRGAGATNHVAGTEVKNVLVEEWANAVTALSTDTKAALAGTSGTPQAANPYVTDADARNSDARTPTAHGHVEGDTTGLVSDLAARVLTTDSRLSDARTPTTHAISHKATGGDVLASIVGGYAPLDSGLLVPVANLGTGTPTGSKFLRDDRVWAVPAGGGGSGTDVASILTTPGDLLIESGSSYARLSTPTASASSTNSGFVASNAFDGNTGTFWGSNVPASTPGEWLNGDFGSAVTPTAVRLLQSAAGQRVGQWKLQSSPDNSTWTDRYTSATGQESVADSGILALTGMPSARYWRILSVSSTDGSIWLVYELYLYSGGGPTPVRLAAGQTLTDAATITWDVTTGHNAQVTLGGNRTLAAPTNLIAGQVYTLQVVQDGTGSRTLTWNAVFKWPGGTAPTLSTGAGKRDVFVFVTDGTNLYATVQAIDVR